MKFVVKLLFLPAFMLVFSACGIGESRDLPLERLLPADIDAVLVLDASDSDQREQIELLVERLPDLNLEEKLKDNEYAKLIKPILEDEWKLVFGMNFEEEDVYVLGEFDEEGKMEDLIDLFFEEREDYWISEDNAFYLAEHDDLFVLTNKEENLEPVGGFGAFTHEGFGYAYMSVSGAAKIAEVAPGISGFNAVFSADENGVVIESSSEELNFDLVESSVNLADKVFGENLISYSEYNNFAFHLDSSSLDLLYDFDGSMWKVLADNLEMSEEEVEKLMAVPFAFSLHEFGLYPGFSFLLDVDDETLDQVQRLSLAIDAWIDRMIVEFDALMEVEGFGVGAIKKDVEIISGVGMHKVSFDWDALPKDILAAAVFVPGLNVEEIKLELYYGVIDGMFIFAFYPDFGKDYGENPLSENDLYQEAMEKVEGPGFALSYFETSSLIEMTDRWVKMATDAEMMTEESRADYDLYIGKLMAAVSYIVSSSESEEKITFTNGYVKIADEQDEG